MLRTIIALAWISAITLALPFPPKQIAFLKENVDTLQNIVIEEIRRDGQQVTDALVAQRMEEAVESEKRRLWMEWAFTASMILIGLITAVLAIKNAGPWPFLALVTSTWYVLAFLWHFARHSGSFLEAYSTTANGVMREGLSFATVEFLHLNVVLPVVHLGLLAVLLLRLKSITSADRFS